MGISDLALGVPRGWFSTQDYWEACERQDSTHNSEQINNERIKNEEEQKIKRAKIETELNKIPPHRHTMLKIYIKCSNSNEKTPNIEVHIVSNDSIFEEDGFEIYNPYVDAKKFPKIWEKFNHLPFLHPCIKCGQNVQKYIADTKCLLCRDSKNK